MTNPEFLGLIHSLQATAEAALGDINAATAWAGRDGLLAADRAHQTAESRSNCSACWPRKHAAT